MDTKLPTPFKPYFWDVDFNGLTAENSPNFIIKRVLDRGNTFAIKWLRENFSDEQIKSVLSKTKDLSRPTGNFWADLLKLDKSSMPCLTKPYSPIHFGLYS